MESNAFFLLVIFGSLAIFLLLSVPIGVSLGLTTLIGLWITGLVPTALIADMFNSLNSFPLMAVPFFIMAGEIMQKGTMADRLLNVSRALVGNMPGGMGHVSVLTSMFYGALSGSAPATVAAVGGIMIPAMEKEGYSKPFSSAVNTAAGCVGVIIPPSVPLIIYGTVAAGASVGDLFIAGILPGILIGLSLMATVHIIAVRNAYRGAGMRWSFKAVFVALGKAIPALVVPLIVLGGIYGGVFTPTEAGIAAAGYAIIMEGVILRTLRLKDIFDIFSNTALTTASIFLLIATATAFGQLLLFNNVPDTMVSFLRGISSNPLVLLPIIILFLLVMGTFMDALANILILTPLLLPVVTELGYHPVHFGIIMIITASIGFLTPPVGVNLFVGCSVGNISIEKLSFAVLPFIFAMLAALMLIIFIPQITLILL